MISASLLTSLIIQLRELGRALQAGPPSHRGYAPSVLPPGPPTLPPAQEEVQEKSQNDGDHYRCAERNEHSQVASFKGKVSGQRPDSHLPHQEENSPNYEQHQSRDYHELADRLHA